MWFIGYGGTGFNSLSYNPVNERLYVCCGGVSLYEINMTKGERDLICSFNGEPSWLISIAFDKNGILYGWDDVNLWIINIENCEGTLVGPHGIDVYYDGYGHFDFDTDILYISTYSSSGKLYECDEDTGECTLVGNFEGGAEITALAIPYFCSYYPPDPAHDPIPPDGADNVPGDAILCWNGSDPDSGDSLTYDVFFSINYPPILVSNNQTETCYDPYDDMPLFEEYYWRIVTWDSGGEFTSSPIWSFKTGYTQYEIEIDGPTRGRPGITYYYNFSIDDYDGPRLLLWIDWGDGTNQTEWLNPGENVTIGHCWKKKGTYVIRAMAEDQYGEYFYSYHIMIIPRNKAINLNFNLLSWFFERFSLLERLLSLIRVI
jgi:hypothetical protein